MALEVVYEVLARSSTWLRSESTLRSTIAGPLSPMIITQNAPSLLGKGSQTGSWGLGATCER
eukprot:13029775-Alexandrium_andersonii.AAC.1